MFVLMTKDLASYKTYICCVLKHMNSVAEESCILNCDPVLLV